MIDSIIIAVILVAIVGLAGFYVYKAKKSGKRCVGCPDGGCNCHEGKKEGSCDCGCGCSEKK